MRFCVVFAGGRAQGSGGPSCCARVGRREECRRHARRPKDPGKPRNPTTFDCCSVACWCERRNQTAVPIECKPLQTSKTEPPLLATGQIHTPLGSNRSHRSAKAQCRARVYWVWGPPNPSESPRAWNRTQGARNDAPRPSRTIHGSTQNRKTIHDNKKTPPNVQHE